MKIFKDLKIGDTIYKIEPAKSIVVRKDGAGYFHNDGNIIETSKVKYLDIDDDGNLRINGNYSSYNGWRYDYVLKPETATSTSFKDKGGHIVFADKRLAYQLARKQVLSGIKELEAKIPAVIKQVESDIKSVRERYFNVLNGPEYDLTEVVDQ